MWYLILKVMDRIIKFIREFFQVICITLITGVFIIVLFFAIILAFIQLSIEEISKWIYKKFSTN